MNVLKPLACIAFALFISSVPSEAQLYRNLDGTGNNIANPNLGAIHHPMRIMTSLDYSNGINTPAGWNRANARTISNEIFSSIQPQDQQHNLTSMVWAFGKFIEHDITYFEHDEEEIITVKVPDCDQFLDPDCSGTQSLILTRAKAVEGTGRSLENPRNTANYTTAFIDASSIYSTDEATAQWLRTGVHGKLKVSEGNMLPFNTTNGELNGPTDPNAPPMNQQLPGTTRYFVSGDPRVNENIAILALNTLFVREHNRLCDELLRQSPGYTDEGLYQKARSMVAGIIQSIFYNEWLPAVGIELDEYHGYNPYVDPTIGNEFGVAGFKIWNSLMTDEFDLLDDFCNPIPMGKISFYDQMFNPMKILKTDLSPILKGLAQQRQQNMDGHVIEEIRNFHFNSNGLEIKTDLITLDIMRGRERGIPDYNRLRILLGLDPVHSFEDITNDPALQSSLKKVYQNINNIDAWVGMVSEPLYPGSIFGETMHYLLHDQFDRLRRGDRFFYMNDPLLNYEERERVHETTFADVIRRNTDLSFIQDQIFKYDPHCLEFEAERQHLAGQVFPNPVSHEVNVSIYSREEGPGTLRILSSMGGEVHSTPISLKDGINLIHTQVPQDLPSGFYVVQIVQKNTAGSIKFVKTN